MIPLPSTMLGIALMKAKAITLRLPGPYSQDFDQLSDAENEQELERAIDDIIKYDPLGIYKKVKADTKDSPPVSA